MMKNILIIILCLVSFFAKGQDSLMTSKGVKRDTASLLSAYKSAIQTNTTNIGTNTTAIAGKQGTITLTTTGASGASTLIGNTLNIPQYAGGGAISSIANLKYLGNVSGSTAAPTALNYSVYNVKDFGLVDDSVTDNTISFRALVALIPDGARIYFPGGGLGYSFTDSILINKNVIIYGDGKSFFKVYTINNIPQKGATNLYFSAGNKNFFCFHSSTTNKNPIVYVRDLTLQSTSSTTPTTSNGIVIYDGVGNHMLNFVTVAGFFNDVNCVSGNNLSLEFCDILSPVQDAIVLGNTLQPDYGDWHITHCKIYSGLNATTVARGIYIKGGGTINISNNFFNAQATLTINTGFIYPIYTDFSQALTSEINISNNFFDNYQTNGIRMRNYSGTRIWNTILSGNQFAPLYNNAGTLAAIDVIGFDHLLIGNTNGVQLASTSYPVVKLDSCDDVTIAPIIYHGYNADYSASANCTNIRKVAYYVDSAWMKAGTVVGATDYIGSSNAADLKFGTAGTIKMTLRNSNGMLGIGQTSPVNSIDILQTDASIKLTGAGSATYPSFYMYNDNNALAGSISIGNTGVGAPYQNNLVIGARLATGALVFTRGVSGTEMARFDNTGKFGIGNISPASTLDVTGTANISTTATVGTSIQTPVLMGGTVTTQALTYKTTTGIGAAGADHIFQVGSNGATEAMRILNSGNVGIGVVNPLTKLELPGASTTNSVLKIGSLEFQPYSLNNAFFGENIYYNGGFKYRATGFASFFSFGAGDFSVNTAPSGSAGVIATTTQRFKIFNGVGVSIGPQTATAALHIQAGTATAGTGPLKFTAGVLLTTPEAGIMETDASNQLLYSTSTTAASRGYVLVDRLTTTATSLTADATQSTILVTATGQTSTLPTAVGLQGRRYTVKLTVAGTSTLATTLSQTIDGATTYSLSAQYKYVTVQSDNANWFVIANN